jgi:hypothetical protein
VLLPLSHTCRVEFRFQISHTGFQI